MLKKKYLQFYLLAFLLLPLSVFAEGQFYFLATTATQGATSSSGQGAKVVYLRWDVVEGDLPDDIVSIELFRDDVLLLAKDIGETMTVDEIAALYQRADQEQRLLTTVSRLKETAIADGDDFNVSQYPVAILDHLNRPDGYFAGLASKLDFNLAQARYRGFIDSPAAGEYIYTLYALNAVGQKVVIGQLVLDTSVNRNVLPVSDFKQVRQSQCDVPESAKDHYTVSLDWDTPGIDNLTDKLASSLFISGYDLYRGKTNLDIAVAVAPEQDIALLASTSAHNNRGEVQIATLEKVNTLPLMINAGKGGDAEWVETFDRLQKAGLKPGDRRAYYLVPIDFTGHYGATAKTIVTVPDLLRPAEPWDVTFFSDDTDNEMRISWDRIDLANYLNAYDSYYRFCNVLTAESDGVLEYVAKNESCGTAVHRRISLDVVGYKVYRFDSFQAASAFVDSDGDGYANLFERLPDVGKPADARLNMQCDYSVQPALGKDFMVAALKPADQSLRLSEVSEQLLADTGRRRVTFTDKQPPLNKGKVFWYRIAAVTSSDRYSRLTPPLRAVFPDRTLPQKPAVTVTRPSNTLIGCEVTAQTNSNPWNFTNNVEGIPRFAIQCGDVGTLQTLEVASDTQLATKDQGLCVSKEVLSCNTSTVRRVLMSSEDGFSCKADLPDGLSLCSDGQQATIEPVYGEPVPTADGALVSGPLTITLDVLAGSCASLYQTIDNQQSKVATSCGSDTPNKLVYEAGPGLFCGYAVAQDSNNNVSVPEIIPCPLARQHPSKPPSMPKIIAQQLLTDSLRISWKLPSEPLAATMIRLIRTVNGQPAGSATLISVPVAGRSGVERITHDIPITKIADATQSWCTSLQTVSPARSNEKSLSSGWTSPVCTDKDPVPVNYLPWPEVTRPPLGDKLQVKQDQAILFIDLFAMTPDRETCSDSVPADKIFSELVCFSPGYFRTNKEISGYTSLMVYRQSMTDGVAGDWIQVSPLIEFAHWDEITISDNPAFVLNDPYIKIYPETGAKDQWSFVFVDNYPYRVSGQYRYQIVFFANDHSLNLVRISDWFTEADWLVGQ